MNDRGRRAVPRRACRRTSGVGSTTCIVASDLEIEATSDETWTAAYPYYPDDDTLGERIGSLLGSDDGRFTHASAHLPDLRAYVDATRR